MSVLFSPIRLGDLTLKNRLVMAPMGTCLDNGGYITDDTVAYYERRARGGVGAITVEGCLVSADTVGPEPRISGPEYLPGLRRIVDALRPHDVTVGVQLMHPGRQVVDGPSVAPSPVPLNSFSPVPHELTVPEIDVIVADYARAAVFAREAGFDFVEVHGAHGYLPSNFLSPQHNHRADAYGGSLTNRARFAVEVARAIVDAVDLPLVWRLNGRDAEPGGLEIDDAVAVARMLADADVPVMAVGRLDDPALAASLIESGEADLILLGRGLIAEPDWPLLVQQDRLDEVRPCIACNACVDLVGRGERARCSVNPEVGRELTWSVTPALQPRRVMVVGSGPAGLEAARIARLRGHDVSIWERDSALGGKLEVAGLAPSKHEVLRFKAFQAARLAALGVEIHTSSPVSNATIRSCRPDVVVIATGADPLVPPIPGIDGPTVHDAQALLRGEVAVGPGTRVVVVGGSATGCETAELARARGAEVAIVEMRGSIGRGIEAITRRRLIRHLRRDGVEILTEATVVDISPEAVTWSDADGARHSLGSDVVALAIGWRPTGTGDLTLDDIEVHVLGDADTPADFVAAVNSGADAALTLLSLCAVMVAIATITAHNTWPGATCRAARVIVIRGT